MLGDLDKRIKKLKRELEECTKGAINYSENGDYREQVVRFKLGRLEEEQELLWLTKGDRNTKFYQASATERKKSNTIKHLRREDGVLAEGDEGMKALLTNYSSSLFTPVAGIRHGDFLSIISPKVTTQMNELLVAEFTEEKVKRALDNISDLKAPGQMVCRLSSTRSIGSWWDIVWCSRAGGVACIARRQHARGMK